MALTAATVDRALVVQDWSRARGALSVGVLVAVMLAAVNWWLIVQSVGWPVRELTQKNGATRPRRRQCRSLDHLDG